MINVLYFDDSNTFGTNPKGGHHSWNIRWPGRPQVLLRPEYYVIEEDMGGRTTAWDDPLESGQCGIQVLPMALQSHKPLDLITLFLGTNDYKAYFHASPGVITKGVENLCHAVQGSNYGGGHKKPKILVISSIHVGNNMGHCPYVSFDETAPGKSMILAPFYQELAKAKGCLFLDTASPTGPNSIDQLHMDIKSHGALAEGIAGVVKGYFEPWR